MAGMLDLPSEIISHVFKYLSELKDISSARLANDYLSQSSYQYFGQRYFRKKGFLITTSSLGALKGISEHKELRKFVQHVWFNPDLYTFLSLECAPGRESDLDNGLYSSNLFGLSNYDPYSASSMRKYNAYVQCKKDHESLLYSRKLEQELAAIFFSLPSLEYVGMRRSEDHHPWGCQALKEAIGEDPRILGPIPAEPRVALSGPTHLFTAIVHAAARTPNLQLKRLYTDVIEIDNILPAQLSQETLNKACRSILYLELNASNAYLSHRPNLKAKILKREADYGEILLRLFKATPQLRELGLQIFRNLEETYLRSPDGWRLSYPYLAFQRVVDNVQLSSLTRLKLEKVVASPSALKAFIAPSRNYLTSLKIRDIRLLSDNQHARPWQSIFEFLRDDVPNLSYLLLYHLMHDAGGISFVRDEGQDNNEPEDRLMGGRFKKYDHIAVEGHGRDDVEAKLDDVVENHWYLRPLFSYAMDESLWHTDTSDEED